MPISFCSILSIISPMMGKAPIRVLLADDHPIVLSGLRTLLENTPGFRVVATVTSGEGAVSESLRLAPDLALLDLFMPGLGGAEAARRILRRRPKVRVLILSFQDSAEAIQQVLAAGAHGFIRKTATPKELLEAVRAVANGQFWFSGKATLEPPLVEAPARRTAMEVRDLTTRETEVLRHLAEGRSNRQIAALLGISVRTVESHRERLHQKLGLRGAAALTRFALAHGLSSLS